MNNKIKNATPTFYDGITFKSKLEVLIYKTFKENGFDIKYEPFKYVIWKGFKPTVPFYIADKKTKILKEDNKKILDITYTPDIVIFYKTYMVFIEVKPTGFANDVYPYKRKLFRKFLEDTDQTAYRPIFCQIGSKKQALDFIKILKEYK